MRHCAGLAGMQPGSRRQCCLPAGIAGIAGVVGGGGRGGSGGAPYTDSFVKVGHAG